MKIDKKNWVIIGMAVLLVGALGWIGVGKYQGAKQEEQLGIFQQGAQYGYEQAVVQVVQQAVTCEQVPISVGNQTINVVAVECLQEVSK